MTVSTPKLCFQVSPSAAAEKIGQLYIDLYGNYSEAEADIIVVLGGDGFMLRSLHQYHDLDKPFYGINCGSVGFLMNAPEPAALLQNLLAASLTKLFPLKMTAYTAAGTIVTKYAINEVSLFRQTPQGAKLKITIDGVVRIEELVCDGVLIATPAGSTAYNLSVYGPIIPIGARLLALTPISPFRPRRWRGALLPDLAQVSIEVIAPEFRTVSAAADDQQVNDVIKVEVCLEQERNYELLFDPDHNLEARLVQEQFSF